MADSKKKDQNQEKLKELETLLVDVLGEGAGCVGPETLNPPEPTKEEMEAALEENPDAVPEQVAAQKVPKEWRRYAFTDSWIIASPGSMESLKRGDQHVTVARVGKTLDEALQAVHRLEELKAAEETFLEMADYRNHIGNDIIPKLGPETWSAFWMWAQAAAAVSVKNAREDSDTNTE